MLRDLGPLFAYMRRYRWGYLWGCLSVVGTNAWSPDILFALLGSYLLLRTPT